VEVMGIPAIELRHLESGFLCKRAGFKFGNIIELLVLVPSLVSTWNPDEK
jgi:hypothetical protein